MRITEAMATTTTRRTERSIDRSTASKRIVDVTAVACSGIRPKRAWPKKNYQQMLVRHAAG
jgi:hypothetical protein